MVRAKKTVIETFLNNIRSVYGGKLGNEIVCKWICLKISRKVGFNDLLVAQDLS